MVTDEAALAALPHFAERSISCGGGLDVRGGGG